MTESQEKRPLRSSTYYYDEGKKFFHTLVKNRQPILVWQKSDAQSDEKIVYNGILRKADITNMQLSWLIESEDALVIKKNKSFYFYVSSIPLLGKAKVEYTYHNTVATKYPNPQSLRLPENRKDPRIKLGRKKVSISIQRGSALYEGNIVNFSSNGLGVKLPIVTRSNMRPEGKVRITKLGNRVLKKSLEAIVVHLSEGVRIPQQGLNHIVLGLKLTKEIPILQMVSLIEQVV